MPIAGTIWRSWWRVRVRKISGAAWGRRGWRSTAISQAPWEPGAIVPALYVLYVRDPDDHLHLIELRIYGS